MMQELQLPDENLRDGLKEDKKALQGALRELKSTEDSAAYAGDVDTAETHVRTALDSVEEHLDDIPEWDADLVADVLDAVGSRDDVRIEREGLNVWFSFEAAGETWRFEVALSGGNRWLHKRTDDGWSEVWSKKSR